MSYLLSDGPPHGTHNNNRSPLSTSQTQRVPGAAGTHRAYPTQACVSPIHQSAPHSSQDHLRRSEDSAQNVFHELGRQIQRRCGPRFAPRRPNGRPIPRRLRRSIISHSRRVSDGESALRPRALGEPCLLQEEPGKGQGEGAARRSGRAVPVAVGPIYIAVWIEGENMKI